MNSERSFRGLTGQDRAVMYLLAQRTGLRRKELVSLTPESFDLSISQPSVKVAAKASKHRKTDLLPLPADVVKVLTPWIATRPPLTRLWPGGWWRRSSDMLKLDLLDAGIEPTDSAGQVVDFHGQRTTFITGLAQAGVSPAAAQRLARHSDINLTLGTYTKLQVDELRAAVQRLPSIGTSAESPTADRREGETLRTNPASDPDLAEICRVWPELTDSIRKAVVGLIATLRGSK